MSRIDIEFPDCGKASPDVNGGDHITITMNDCLPPRAEGPPPLISGGLIVAILIAVLALVIGTTVARVIAHDKKPAKLEQKRLLREADIKGQVAIAQAHKQCRTCGDKYEPVLK